MPLGLLSWGACHVAGSLFQAVVCILVTCLPFPLGLRPCLTLQDHKGPLPKLGVKRNRCSFSLQGAGGLA